MECVRAYLEDGVDDKWGHGIGIHDSFYSKRYFVNVQSSLVIGRAVGGVLCTHH